MSDHLRFTIDEYSTIVLACRQLSSSVHVSAFRRDLADTLRPTHANLADQVARWNEQQVCVLLGHLRAQRESRNHRTHDEPESRTEKVLSIEEWRAIVAACSVIWLREDSLTSFKGSLVQEVAAVEPVLAEKLDRLNDHDIAALYRRVKSGRRWCP